MTDTAPEIQVEETIAQGTKANEEARESNMSRVPGGILPVVIAPDFGPPNPGPPPPIIVVAPHPGLIAPAPPVPFTSVERTEHAKAYYTTEFLTGVHTVSWTNKRTIEPIMNGHGMFLEEDDRQHNSDKKHRIPTLASIKSSTAYLPTIMHPDARRAVQEFMATPVPYDPTRTHTHLQAKNQAFNILHTVLFFFPETIISHGIIGNKKSGGKDVRSNTVTEMKRLIVFVLARTGVFGFQVANGDTSLGVDLNALEADNEEAFYCYILPMLVFIMRFMNQRGHLETVSKVLSSPLGRAFEYAQKISQKGHWSEQYLLTNRMAHNAVNPLSKKDKKICKGMQHEHYRAWYLIGSPSNRMSKPLDPTEILIMPIQKVEIGQAFELMVDMCGGADP
jgi:hypothetical protein